MEGPALHLQHSHRKGRQDFPAEAPQRFPEDLLIRGDSLLSPVLPELLHIEAILEPDSGRLHGHLMVNPPKKINIRDKSIANKPT